jgi:hypothetical protein
MLPCAEMWLPPDIEIFNSSIKNWCGGVKGKSDMGIDILSGDYGWTPLRDNNVFVIGQSPRYANKDARSFSVISNCHNDFEWRGSWGSRVSQSWSTNEVSAIYFPRRILLMNSNVNQAASYESKQDGRDRRDNAVVAVGKSSGTSQVRRGDNDGLIMIIALLGSGLAAFLTYAGLKGR